MSVSVPVIDYIDGATRRIYLLQGVDAFHWIEDVYREYLNLRGTDESLQKWFPMMVAKGNEPKDSEKNTPRYVVLQQDARVIPYDENILITVTGEAITDNPDVDPDPFDTTTRTQPLKLYITPPAAELVKAADELVAIQRMAFDERITVNVNSGFAGTDWPTGTLGKPSNNLADALVISATNDIFTLSLLVDTVVDSGEDYRGMTLIGASKTKTEITVSEAAQVNNCEFYDAHVTGTLDGDSTLKGCVIDNLNYVTGFIEECVLDAGTVLLGAGATAHFLDCWSGVPGTSTPTIDMGGSGQALAMRNYNGGIAIINKTGTESVSLDLNSGQVKLDLETVTNGTIVVRGIGKVIEMTTGESLGTGYYGDLYLLNEAINRENISAAVWDEPISDHLVAGTTGRSLGVNQFNGVVTLSTTGTSGTVFPTGTERVPVDNWSDAIAIAAENGIDTFHLESDFDVPAGTYVGYKFFAVGRQAVTLNIQNAKMNKCIFENIGLTGSFDPTSACGFRQCSILNLSNITMQANECVFYGTVELSNVADSNLYNCFDGVPGIGIPDIQLSTCSSLGIWNWIGGIRLSNISTPDTVITCMIGQGRLWVDETCVEGDIIVKGLADLRGETAGTTIDSEGLISGEALTERIWSYERIH